MPEQITATREHQLHKVVLEWRPDGSFRLARAIFWEVVSDEGGEEIARRVLPPEGIAGRALADGRLKAVLDVANASSLAQLDAMAAERDQMKAERDRGARRM